MEFFKEINDHINKFLCGMGIDSRRWQEEKIKKEKIEKRAILERQRIEKQRIEKLEKDARTKEWPNVKDGIYSRYQLPIADDAKNIAKDLLNNKTPLFGKNIDTVSVFFITDERVIKRIYVEGGYKAIDEYAKNLTEHAFIGGPITATLLRRLKLLEDAKRDGKVIDTEIDIDGFVPHAGIKYAIEEIELDGQIIPARRKFSIRCEMTATITEGFRTGPFVPYEELYISTKEDIEQITDENLKSNISNSKIPSKNKDDANTFTGKKYGNMHHIKMCPHGTDETLYCDRCRGDIIISPSKKKIVGICLDISGSMEGNKLSNAKTAVIKVLDRIPVNSNIDVVLIVFNGDIAVGHEDIIPFGKRYTESIKYFATERINCIFSGGYTPLYDTINYFLDEIWSRAESSEKRFLQDENHIFYPYTYLVIISDGEENGSELRELIYKGKMGYDAFFDKLKTYRDAGLITEIIPFAYGGDETNNGLIRELRKISGKKLINKVDPENIIESLTSNVDSILYGSDNLKMMGLPIIRKDKD